jgi:GNAT superfamily N-acetyltransferase
VVAYYSLAPHVVRREDMPKKIARGSLREIPSILLARLALAERFQDQGLGSALLADALTRILDVREQVGGSVIVVDAIDERASQFYEHHGFIRTPSDRYRLVIKASRVDVSKYGS